MKIVTIVGARPQFVKAAVVSREFSAYKNIQEVIIHTGQHFDTNMSDIFFEEMHIPKPNYNLNINGLSHGAMTGQMLEKIERLLIQECPDWVLVYGDTNSTLAGALAAKKLHIKVAHVEAGLRSFNMKMPEEINRILTDRLSDILFCPTDVAIKNLMEEGYGNIKTQIIKSGDVMQDAALFYAEKAKKPSIDIPQKFILTTIHRAENTDDPAIIRSIFSALEIISANTPIILPLHPRTRKKLEDLQYRFDKSNILFIEPLGYLEMVYLLKHCILVMTDSGGLQKEAFFFKKRCVILREETEWVELVENNYNIISGSDKNFIVGNAQKAMENNNLNFDINLYGDGQAGRCICSTLLDFDKKN